VVQNDREKEATNLCEMYRDTYVRFRPVGAAEVQKAIVGALQEQKSSRSLTEYSQGRPHPTQLQKRRVTMK